MSSHYPPLECKKVKKILAYLGFYQDKNRGGSHEQWIKDEGGTRYKVTVDCSKEPFSQTLVSYMADQAGISKKNFYGIRDKV